MILKIRSQKTGLMKLVSLIQRPRSLKIGMRMLHSKFLMKRPPNQRIGLMTSLPWFLIQRLRSQRTGMMKKMVIGLLLRFQTPNALKLLAVANGRHQ